MPATKMRRIPQILALGVAKGIVAVPSCCRRVTARDGRRGGESGVSLASRSRRCALVMIGALLEVLVALAVPAMPPVSPGKDGSVPSPGGADLPPNGLNCVAQSGGLGAKSRRLVL